MKQEKQIRALVLSALANSSASEAATANADRESESMSQSLLNAAKLCATAAKFKAETSGELGPWLKTDEGQAWCKANGVPVTFSDKTGAVVLPKRFKQFSTNILRGMLDHENPALRDANGAPLVGHISTFKTEKAVRKAVTAENVTEARALNRVQTQDGLTEEQRAAGAHEVQVYAGIRQQLEAISRHSKGLKGDRVDEAYKVLSNCATEMFRIFTAQTDADNAAKAAAAALPEAPAHQGQQQEEGVRAAG